MIQLSEIILKKRIETILPFLKKIFQILKLSKNKKVNFIYIKLFVTGSPDIFVSEIIFSNTQSLWKNTTEYYSQIFNQILVFFECFLRSIFSIVFETTCEPNFKSNTIVLLDIIKKSKSSDDIIELIISTHKPNH